MGENKMKAQLLVNKSFKIGDIDKRIYGSFIEHLGRAVYGGIYEPTHESANELGFRTDVLELVKKLNVPVVRYPGGNFVSGYNWEDGTGKKENRPKKIDQAWFAIESNEVGVDEFQQWARLANTEVMMAVNLGTRGAADARNCVEYCNGKTDTYYANMRRENGFAQPFGFKVWCLGNEMDGFWQIGHKTAEEYARLAEETAKLMKWVDPDIELVACGSSSLGMPTFGDWELTVLDRTYDYVDYISLHQYYSNADNNTEKFLSRSDDMNDFIKGTVAICDAVGAKKHSKKKVNLSFDEWNVWYHSRENDKHIEKWLDVPPRLEDVYNFEDALLIGSMLMTMQNNCDRVKMACLAQLVNVIAPIMTENGGKAWAQTIFYPYMYASNYGRGAVLNTILSCDSYSTDERDEVKYLVTSTVYNAEKDELVIFAVNRSLSEDIELSLTLDGFESYRMCERVELYCDDLKAVNDKDTERVSPKNVPVSDSAPVLKKHSWNMLVFKKA